MTNKRGKFFELNNAQVQELIRLANFRSRDVFCDLGSGEGQAVIGVAKVPSIKRSIGIERLEESSEIAKRTAIRDLKPHQLKKTSFWFGEMDATSSEEWTEYLYDLNDVTVLYYSLHEGEDTLDWLDDHFESRRLRIITKDLPFVGYRATANRRDRDCWFFLTNYPLASGSRIRSKIEWAESVLGVRNVTLDHVRSYFGGQLSKRKAYSKKAVIDSLLDLEKLINARF